MSMISSAFRVVLGVIVLASGAVGATPPETLPRDPRVIDVLLANGSADPVGDDIGLVMGASGVPLPQQISVATTDQLYFRPHGFTGHADALFTPEPTSNTDAGVAADVNDLMTAINSHIPEGGNNPADPLWIFGYSQSAAAASRAMDLLHDQGVTDNVHFVLVGDPASPYGGLLSTLLPSLPGWLRSVVELALPAFALDQTMGLTTPDYYPTEVYTLEYDGFADFPRYPFNLLSDLNAVVGMLYEHEQYLGLSAAQLANPAFSATEGAVNYHVIGSEYLPLLVGLHLIPIIGKPLYDLLEPDTRILVNLGYGSITDGWNSQLANVDTDSVFPLFPANLNVADVLAALSNGTATGLREAVGDLLDPSTYQLTPIVDDPTLSTLLTALYQSGGIDTPNPSSLLEVVVAVVADLFGPGL